MAVAADATIAARAVTGATGARVETVTIAVPVAKVVATVGLVVNVKAARATRQSSLRLSSRAMTTTDHSIRC